MQTLFIETLNNTAEETNKQDKLGSSTEELSKVHTGNGKQIVADQKYSEGNEKIIFY